MARIQADQIEVGAGPQHAITKYGPGPGWELIASRLRDTGSLIDLPSRSVNIGDVAQANNGTSIALNDVNKSVFVRAGKSATSRASLDMDLEDNEGQAVLNAIQGAITTRLFLQPGSSRITLEISPEDSGTLELKAGVIELNTPKLQQNAMALGVVGSVSLLGQTGSASPIALTVNGVAPSAGLYRISYYLVITTAGTSGSVKATFRWADPGGERAVDSSTITFGTLADPASGALVVRSSGVLSISYETVVTSPVGDPEYALYVTLEQLQ